METTRYCMVSPHADRIDHLRAVLTGHPEWGAELVYTTCDPDTCLNNLHLYEPTAFIIDLALESGAVTRLLDALQSAGYAAFIFLGTNPDGVALPGEVVAPGAPAGSLLEAMRRLGPLQEEESLPAAVEPASRSRKVCIAVHSPKGGTGKTLIACSLARQYAARGIRTLLIDLAMYGGVAPSLGISRREAAMDELVERFARASHDELSTVAIGTRSLFVPFPAGDHVLYLLPAGSPLKMAKLGFEAVDALLSAALAEPFDVVILDTSSELSERTLAALKRADYTLLVVTPELPAVWAVRSMQDLLTNLNVGGNLQVVLNRNEEGPHLGRELEELLGYPVVAQVPVMRSPWQSAVERSLAFNYTVAGIALKQLAQRYYPAYGPVELPVGKQ